MKNTTSQRYINPMTDFGFKKIFGEKDIMIAFLTDLLNPESPIEDIEFLDKDLVAESFEMRGVIYDLRCRTADGAEFIVEMQNRYQSNFNDRIVFYLSRSFSTQERKGDHDWNYELCPVYGIFFLNFRMNGLQQRARRTIQLQVVETGEVFSTKLKAFTFELADFKGKPLEYPKEKLDYWFYNLANMETMTTNLPFQNEQPIFNKIGSIAELANMTAEEISKYHVNIDTVRTARCVMRYEREEGRAEGRTEGMTEGIEIGMQRGIAKGKNDERNALVKAMKEQGIPDEQIAIIANISLKEVRSVLDM
ncbi:MAG: Rpn family recombination-promoting nuclease/putative transposase [Bacteroidia bacterium]|nr:Rpn family recombination-promoting nuclease/putative transposase [Bacteroidia bacterium]